MLHTNRHIEPLEAFSYAALRSGNLASGSVVSGGFSGLFQSLEEPLPWMLMGDGMLVEVRDGLSEMF